MEYIEAPEYKEITTARSLFLAGGITGVHDWQWIFLDTLKDCPDLTICNPRRKNFEIFKNNSNFNESRIQIKWEFEYLRKVKDVVIWFSNETIQPIVLLELGARLSEYKHLKQNLFIGIHPNYSRIFDLLVQIPLIDKNLVISSTLHDLTRRLKLNYGMDCSNDPFHPAEQFVISKDL